MASKPFRFPQFALRAPLDDFVINVRGHDRNLYYDAIVVMFAAVEITLWKKAFNGNQDHLYY
jgi:hypothetical protein